MTDETPTNPATSPDPGAVVTGCLIIVAYLLSVALAILVLVVNVPIVLAGEGGGWNVVWSVLAAMWLVRRAVSGVR